MRKPNPSRDRIRAATVRERGLFQSRACPERSRGNRKRAASRQHGFTLLEALVATAVLGAAVAALLGLFSGALRNAARIEAPEQALLLGQSKLNELLATGVTTENRITELPLDRTIAGRWDERFRWEARATRFRSSPEPKPGEILLARITLDVFWKTGAEGAERKLSFETYQLRREPAEAAP